MTPASCRLPLPQNLGEVPKSPSKNGICGTQLSVVGAAGERRMRGPLPSSSPDWKAHSGTSCKVRGGSHSWGCRCSGSTDGRAMLPWGNQEGCRREVAAALGLTGGHKVHAQKQMNLQSQQVAQRRPGCGPVGLGEAESLLRPTALAPSSVLWAPVSHRVCSGLRLSKHMESVWAPSQMEPGCREAGRQLASIEEGGFGQPRACWRHVCNASDLEAASPLPTGLGRVTS